MFNRSENNKRHYRENIDKYKVNHKNWLAKNKNYEKEYQKEYKYDIKRGRKKLPVENVRYLSYRANAKSRGFIFNIGLEEFLKIINDNCIYCGGKGYGVDRVDNSVGYLLNNCVSCCSRCNKMKSNNTTEEFIEHCKKIVNFNSNTN